MPQTVLLYGKASQQRIGTYSRHLKTKTANQSTGDEFGKQSVRALYSTKRVFNSMDYFQRTGSTTTLPSLLLMVSAPS